MSEQRSKKRLCPYRKTIIYLSRDNKEVDKDGNYVDEKGNKNMRGVFKVVERFTDCIVGQEGLDCMAYKNNVCNYGH